MSHQEKKLKPDLDDLDPVCTFTDSFDEELFNNIFTSSIQPSKDILNYSEDELKRKDFFGLPNKIRYLLRVHRNINQLYKWQIDLLNKLSLSNQNMIYCVPTSGGKTLVAEIEILKEMILNGKNAIFILPYISIVQEKIRNILPFANELDFVIEEYAGSKGRIPPKKRRKFKCLYIATIEKAHLLLSYLLESKRLNEIGLVVIDELHMLGDGSRGSVLESLIVKLKLSKLHFNENIRIIGMSATLTNIDQVSKFLDANVFKEDYRPVELKQYLKYSRTIYEVNKDENGKIITSFVRKIPHEFPPNDPEGLHFLVSEVIPESSCLIFCPTKKHCENVCSMLPKVLPSSLIEHKKEEKQQLIKEICLANSGRICLTLKKGIAFGIAYHHSGLTSEEKELIESAFLSATLSCIVCTSTLAAGINLPAQRVIIRSPYMGSMFLTAAKFKQMSGRAGRAGFSDKPGESFLIASERDKEKIKELFRSPVNECYSSLKDNNEKGLHTLVLTLFYLKFCSNLEDLKIIIETQTLYGIQFFDDTIVKTLLDDCFKKLIAIGLLSKMPNENYSITNLGKGSIKGLIGIDKCVGIYQRLKAITNCMTLSTHLHLIYTCTLLYDEDDLPIYPNPCRFFENYVLFDQTEIESASVIGVTTSAVVKYRQCGVADEIIKRFYVTMVVYDVYKNNSDFNTLSLKYHIHRGTLQSLMNQISSKAYSILRFVEELEEFWAFRCLFPDLCQRLAYCCVPDLIPLLDLPMVKIARAKMLFAAGFKTIKDIAKAKIEDIVGKIENVSRGHARIIISGARKILIDQVDELQEQADDLTRIVVSEPLIDKFIFD